MQSNSKPLKLDEDQALFFRARRGHLAGTGCVSAADCVRQIIGVQSQQLAPGLLALSQRLASRPTASELQRRLFDPGRDLVRIWGQRETIHIYDSATSWPLVTSARKLWVSGGRRGPLPSGKSELAALKLARKKGTVTKRDFLSLVEAKYVAELDPRIGDETARAKFASGRLVWRLTQDGHLCIGEKLGSRQIYATSRAWFPDLDWPQPLPDPLHASLILVRRYLAVNAPATAQDLAHFFGARVSEARRWLAELETGGELISVECGGRRDLVALACDEEDLQVKPGRSTKTWPMRLLPLWDTLLMSHRDKSWTMPHESERPLVWRKAAYVSPVVLDRGRVVAVWTMKRRGRNLDFQVQPLSGWKPTKQGPAFRREAAAVARHVDLEPGEIRW